MQNGKIGVTTENIFPVIKKFLYSDHEIFLRELISNAVDATQKIKTLSSIGEFKGELGDLTIHVSLDPDKRILTISDSGIGMSAEEIDKYINQIAFSGAEEFLEKPGNYRALRIRILLRIHGLRQGRDCDPLLSRRIENDALVVRRLA